jgi:hypothetical protein
MTCPNCSAQLDIEPSLDPFQCPYCGTELLQPPLPIVSDTARLPAHLAYERLLSERNELSAERTRLATVDARGCVPVIGYLLLLGGSLTLLGALFGGSRQNTLAVCLLVLLTGAGMVTRPHPLHAEIDTLNKRIEALDHLIMAFVEASGSPSR